jgi:hypothetical protein
VPPEELPRWLQDGSSKHRMDAPAVERGPRTGSDRRATTRTLKRGPGSVAGDNGRAIARANAAAERVRHGAAVPAGWAWLGNCFGMLGIALGLFFVIGAVGFFAGSFLLTDVLQEISGRDYETPRARIQRYRDFFAGLSQTGFVVDESKPQILEGNTYYSWSVSPRGTEDIRSFQWVHDLKNMTVVPRTNPALLLDLEMGYIKDSPAQLEEEYNFYNAGDPLALAIARGGDAELMPHSGEGWDNQSGLAAAPPLPPLVDPKTANRRGMAAEEEEEIVAEAGLGEDTGDVEAGDATEVGAQPGGGEESTEVGTGSGDNGGEAGVGGGESGDGGSDEDESTPVEPAVPDEDDPDVNGGGTSGGGEADPDA